MSLRVVVIAPTLDAYRAVATVIKHAGHVPLSNWDAIGGGDLARLSTQQASEIAKELEGLIEQSEVLVSVHDRSKEGFLRGSSFYAGLAYAQGMPVVVVGPYDELGLYAPGIHSVQVDDLAGFLEKFEKRRNAFLRTSTPAKMETPKPQPEQGDTNGAEQLHPPGGPDAGREPGGEVPRVDVGEGSSE